MKNVMQVPRLKKIVLNMGIGDGVEDPKLLDEAVEELTFISGQKPIITKAKKDISNFKIRRGEKIGCKVTLRRTRMYEFMDRFFNIALPRVRDFKGVNDSGFDGKGNFTMGVREQIIFPEVNYEKVQKIRGLNITFVTDSDQDEHVYHLLKALGMPFQKR
jgi:large subunit ribosomal protein L5